MGTFTLNFKLRSFVMALLLLFCSGVVTAQTTVTLSPVSVGTVTTAGVQVSGNLNGIEELTSRRGWARYDLSSIPIGSTVVSASLAYPTSTAVNSGATNNQLLALTFDPSTYTPATGLFTNLNGGQAGVTTIFQGSWAGTHPLALNTNGPTGGSAAAATAMQTYISGRVGTFAAFGIKRGSTNSYSFNASPQLTITYIPSVACSGTPTAGTASGPASVCPSTNFTLSLSGATAASGITYQWQSSPAGAGTFTNIGGATSSSYTASQTAATDYQCVVTCTNAPGGSATSNIVSVAMNSFLGCYCSTSYTSGCATDFISNVTLSTINNASGCNVYTDYGGTVAAPTLNQTTTYTITLSFGSDPNQFWTAWIDYNQNGIFEASENLGISGNAGANGTASQSFTIPLTATLGTTKMRVRGGNDVALTALQACGVSSSNWGETEDYNVTIGPAPACPSPSAGNATGITSSAATLNWTSNAGSPVNWQVEYGLNGFVPTGTATNSGSYPTSGLNLTGLNAGTVYQFYVRDECTAGVFSPWGGPFSFTTALGCGGGFTDAGGAGNYAANSNTTDVICPTNPGDVVTVTFVTYQTETNWDPLYVHNGPSTASPLYASTNGPSTGGFPAGGWWGATPPGPFTSSDPSGCLTFNFQSDGSVQQAGWTANVTCGPPPVCNDPSGLGTTNIQSTSADLSWTENGSSTLWDIYIVPSPGTAPTAGTTPTYNDVNTNSAFALTGLTAATGYDVWVRSQCGLFLNSGWAGPHTFTSAGCPVQPNPGATIASPATACVGQTVNLSLTDPGTGNGFNYQWYSSPDGITYSPVGTNSPTYSDVFSASVWYYADVICPGGSTVASTPVNVTASPPTLCYCQPTNAGGACITNVTVGSLNNTTVGCQGGASNYSQQPGTTNLTQGGTASLTVTTDAAAIMSVWIDYNQDGVFDASEWQQITTNAANATITLNIPGTATLGLTGMRIRSRLPGNQNGAGDACLNMGSGETEDYQVTIGPSLPTPPVCIGSFSPANGATAVSPSVTLTWGPGVGGGSPTGYLLTLGDNAPNYDNIFSATDLGNVTSQALSGLTGSTTYGWKVEPYNSFGVATGCVFNTFTTFGCGDVYVDNGGAGVYANNSNDVLTVCPTNPGDVVTATFTSFQTETNWDPLYVHNGNSTASPLFASTNGVSNGGFPAGGWWGAVAPGPFTSTDPSGCLTFNFQSDGSVQQAGYTANITCGPPPVCADPSAIGATNIQATSADLNWTENGTSTLWDVYVVPSPGTAPTGSTVPTYNNVNVNTAYNIASLNASTSYDVWVRAQCNPFLESAWVGPYTFTTAGCPVQPTPGATQVSPASPCVGATITLSLANPGLGNGFTYQWYSSPDGITYSPIGGATSDTYSDVFTASIWYYADVTCPGGSTVASTPINVTPAPATLCYCQPTNAGSACLTNVSVGSLNNSTAGCSGGTNYSQQPGTTNLIQGTANSFSVTTDGGAIISVWVDYNQNGLYEASEWQQVTTGSTAGSPTVISLNVPVTANLGLTGMRVRSRLTGNQNGAGDACLNMGSGETEDYQVTIIAAPPAPPTCPTSFTPANATVGLGTTTTLTWGGNSGGGTPTHFLLTVGTNAPNYNNILNAANIGLVTSYNLAGLNAGTTYGWKVEPVNNFGTATCGFNTFTTFGCGDTYYDNGGVAGLYANNSNDVFTICPTNVGEVVTATFTSFQTETNWDPLYIHNGNSTASPLFASGNGASNGGFPAGGYWGTAIPGPFTSTDPSGCLTFNFQSDGSVQDLGFAAVITCALPAGANVWLGGSNDWFNPANWSNGVPSGCASDIIIPVAPNAPIIVGATANVGSVDIANGVTLTLQGQNLNVCGNWTSGNGSGSNTTNIGGGEVVFNGTGPQTIGGNTIFQVLTVNNANGVTILSGADVSISEGAHLQTGALTTNGGLTLLSPNATTAAYIDDFSAGFSGTLNGSIVAERGVNSGGNWQHFISSPVNSPALNTLTPLTGANGTYVTPSSTCSENLLDASSATGTAYEWVEAALVTPGCYMGNWMIRSTGNMTNGRAYSVYLGNATYDLAGTANTGNVAVSGLSNSNWSTQSAEGNTFTSGWHLLGNPYPSPVDLGLNHVLTEGFDAQVQVWMPSGPWQGTWDARLMGVDAQLASSQGFQVHNSNVGTPQTFTFVNSERARTSTTNPAYFQMPNQNALNVIIEGNNGRRDRTRVYFNSDATANFDQMYDADKLISTMGYPTVYTWMASAPERRMGINTLTDINTTSTVPMAFLPGADETFTVTAEGLNTFDPTSYIMLEDLQTGTMHNFRNGGYTFTSSVNDARNRFVLHFTPAAQINAAASSCANDGVITVTQPGNAVWNYSITNAQGTILSSGVLNQNTPATVNNLSAGVYTITLADNNGYTVVKNVQVTGSASVNPTFVAPATATVGQDVTFNNTTADAVNYEWNMGDGTIITGIANPTYSYNAAGQYTVTLTVVNANGCSNTISQMVTVGAATGLGNVENGTLNIYGAGNKVYVDFSKLKGVEATIEIYNVIGQNLSIEKFGKSTIYAREVKNLDAAYVIVKVINNGETITRKVFIANSK